MNARLGNYMIVLGLLAMAFYGTMFGLGVISAEILPHFVISSILFLSSGRIMRKAARAMVQDREEETDGEKRAGEEPDWAFLTGLMNWTAALFIIGIMAIFLMKPLGLSFEEAVAITKADEQFYSTAVP